jgi:AraC family transcriptional regulator
VSRRKGRNKGHPFVSKNRKVVRIIQQLFLLHRVIDYVEDHIKEEISAEER